MAKLKYVTYCGLYCKLCANIGRIPRQAKALRKTLVKGGWESFGEYVIPEFNGFWKALQHFSDSGDACPGCRGGCGDPDCEIRTCARERDTTVCSSCSDFPCNHVKGLSRKYPNLIPDAERQKEIGLTNWIAEQEARATTGFCYDDIRYPTAEDTSSND